MTTSENSARYSGLVVAIDGPSGSGKSSVSRGVARKLGLRFLDTGATYRALTWWLLQRGVDPHDAGTISRLVTEGALPVIEVRTDPDSPGVRVDGVEVEPAIRGPEVTAAVSPVSAVPSVRAHLVELQRSLIGDGGVVAEGRDVGTVVTPGAHVKIFLTAAPEARAERRAAQGTAGDDATAMRIDLDRRDHLDSSRTVAPLARAEDAYEVDATSHGLDEVIDLVLGIVATVAEPPRARSGPGAVVDTAEQRARS